jgi:hypothetical protein
MPTITTTFQPINHTGFLGYFDWQQTLLFYLLGFISILPLLIYVTFFEKSKKPESYFGIIGYKIIRWLRRFK